VDEKSTIGIPDLTHANYASHTINLRKDLETYKSMTKKQLDKEVVDHCSKARVRVPLYIVKAIHAFMKARARVCCKSPFLARQLQIR
jgi:hypothetical protein